MNPPPPPPPSSTAILIPSHHPKQPASPPQLLPSIPTVLSDLTSLLQLSAAALRSLPIPITTTSAALLPCPFNPSHRLPPSSLFSHYLNCPTPVSLPHKFHYPNTLDSAASTTAGITPPASASDDLSISLESYMGFKSPANSFFYQNCPGPVTPSTAPPPLVNIPRDLYTECAEFDNGTTLKRAMGFSVDFIRFLPSEIWAIRTEIAGWGGGFPASYSYRILRAIMRLRDCKLLHLSEWIVSNSPRYGVVVDFAIGDHMVSLIRLCLTVVVKEAFLLAGVMPKDGELKEEENVMSPLNNGNFESPVLVKVMMWLSLQFSILYGNVNGKYFTVELLKECILNPASQASVFHSEQKGSEFSAFENVNDMQDPAPSIELTDDTKRVERKNISIETVGNSEIFISQVAAAVAALHERSFVEEKIKSSRNSRPVPAYQRNMEHDCVSKIANEERQKRLDYRPIIEHDGFLWQKSNNQDTSKVKTKEELLAEERDYKRRRMSYRGKKVKRNPVEVMRDIIKEYTEEIKQAGEFDAMSKAREGTEPLASNDSNAQVNAIGVSGSRRTSKIPEPNMDKSLHYRRELSSLDNIEDDILLPRQDFSWDHVHNDLDAKVERSRYGDDYSENRDGAQSSGYSREKMRRREKKGYDEAREGSPLGSSRRRSKSRERNYHKYRDEHDRNYRKRDREDRDRTCHKKENSEDNRNYRERSRRNADGAHQDRQEDSEGHMDRKRSKMKRSRSSYPGLEEFDDRYDPAEPHGLYDNDF